MRRTSRRTRTRETSGFDYGNGGDGAVVISSDTQLASTLDGDMIVKQYTSLTINATKTLTVSNRCKGLKIYVQGDCIVNGTITMTARGAAAAGADISLPAPSRRNVSGSYSSPSRVVIPAAGAAGGVGGDDPGDAGANGQTGGGSSGGGWNFNGAAGTSYGGGSAGGGSSEGGGGSAAAANCGAGGVGGNAYTGDATVRAGAGGGAGNAGGAGGTGRNGGGTGQTGGAGVGGVLILIVGGSLYVGEAGVISADGSKGGDGGTPGVYEGASGGGSGGGSIVIIASNYANLGSVHADGGDSGVKTWYGDHVCHGGAGSLQVIAA